MSVNEPPPLPLSMHYPGGETTHKPEGNSRKVEKEGRRRAKTGLVGMVSVFFSSSRYQTEKVLTNRRKGLQGTKVNRQIVSGTRVQCPFHPPPTFSTKAKTPCSLLRLQKQDRHPSRLATSAPRVSLCLWKKKVELTGVVGEKEQGWGWQRELSDTGRYRSVLWDGGS